MTQTPEGDHTSHLEQPQDVILTEINEYFKDVEFGSAKLLALADNIELHDAENAVDSGLELVAEVKEDKDQSILIKTEMESDLRMAEMKKVILEEKIRERYITLPDYGSTYNKVDKLRFHLRKIYGESTSEREAWNFVSRDVKEILHAIVDKIQQRED